MVNFVSASDFKGLSDQLREAQRLLSSMSQVWRQLDDLPPQALVSSDVVKILLGGCSNQTITRYIARGWLPKPNRGGKLGRKNTWPACEIKAAFKKMKSELGDPAVGKRRGRPRKAAQNYV
jgi:predicted DNA-binding transcriptional regulator AlpA